MIKKDWWSKCALLTQAKINPAAFFLSAPAWFCVAASHLDGWIPSNSSQPVQGCEL
jgi:hypothetical protein